MRISSVFSYYGGKSKIVDCYPRPSHDVVIEPFAGAAAYAWRWRDHAIWINDLDPRTYAIWAFLTSSDALDAVRQYVPANVKAGMRVSEICSKSTPVGLVELMRAEANRGTQGARGVHDTITSMGQSCWHRLRPKMETVIPSIQHWYVTNLPYDQLDFGAASATWFIDPPYANIAGNRYREAAINYDILADWCLSRRGQIIVCENDGASWLPFTKMDHRRVSIRSRYQRANAREVVYTANQ